MNRARLTKVPQFTPATYLVFGGSLAATFAASYFVRSIIDSQSRLHFLEEHLSLFVLIAGLFASAVVFGVMYLLSSAHAKAVKLANAVTEELGRNEALLKLRDEAIEVTNNGVVITDPAQPDNPIVYVNRGFEELTGYERREVLGKNCRFLQGPDTDPQAVEEMRTAIQEQRGCRVFLKNYRKDGTFFWNDLTIKPVYDAKNELTHFVGIQHDVTSLKETEKALRDSERRYEALVNGAPDPIITLDLLGKLEAVNPAFEKVSGYRAIEVVGRHFSQVGFLTFPSLSKALKEFALVASAQGGETFELSIVRKDRKELILEANPSLIERDGKAVGIQVIFRDITERKRAEEALQLSEARFRSAFDHASAGMALISPGGRWLQVNRSLCQILGYAESEILQMTFQALTHPDDLLADLNGVRQMLAGEIQTYQAEKRFFHKVGHVVWVLASTSLVLGEKEEPLHFIAEIQDITQRKLAEEELLHKTEELKRSNKELEEFAYVASHDLQEPLRKITNYAELFAKRYGGGLDSDASKFMNYIVDGARRMQLLINDLLSYSRAGRGELLLEPVPFAEVIQEALANLESSVRESGAVVTYDAMPLLMANRVQMVQVFQNFVSNAIKYRGKDPPRVHVGVRKDRNEHVFSVSDNGIGIDPQYFDRIFVIFQRLHTKTEYPGTGIGLAICKKIMERHGGRVWLESKAGEGSMFYFSLPSRA